MSLRIVDVLDNPTLRTRLLAGRGGIDGTIHWAHSCEDSKPWEWLGQGELVMTSGRALPSEAGGQVDFIRNMANAHLAGLAMAVDMGAPPLTPEALAEADRLGFPILETDYEVPWVLIARAVAEATTRTGQLTKIMRIYDCFRRATQEHASGVEALSRLEKEVAAKLRVVDVLTGRPVMAARADMPACVRDRVMTLGTAPHLPGITRVRDADATHLIIPIGRDREVLIATVTDETIDLVLLQHVGAVVAVLAERSRAEMSTRINSGISMLSLLLQGRIDGEHAKEQLGGLGLGLGPWQVLALRGTNSLDAISIMRLLTEDRPALIVPTDADTTILVRSADIEGVVETVLSSTTLTRLGVSDVVRSAVHIPDAVREARWALETSQAGDGRAVYYGSDRPLFLPRTLTEARDVVARVLGDLLAYDDDHGTQLVASLRTYFAAKRSWQAASKMLEVHKQTLVYRMQRIEQLTGRDLDDLNDVTELHLALRSLDLLDRP